MPQSYLSCCWLNLIYALLTSDKFHPIDLILTLSRHKINLNHHAQMQANHKLTHMSMFCFVYNRYRDPCSLSLNEDDNHTITLVGNANKRAVTLAKTCEQVNELRDCRAPRDWSILALQNTRTGKSHYLVICKCPSHFRLGKLSI
jgi:hypothetical protein